MYTVVLMAAITAGNSAPNHWFRNSCSSCHSCQSCNACQGGSGGWGSYGFANSLQYMHVTGNFCTGSYYQGWAGCTGAWNCYSPYGDYAGYSYYQPFGCYGCYGCYGGMSCYGVPLPGHGWIPEPGRMEVVPSRPEREVTPPPTPKKKVEEKTSISTRARVVVELPEDARLFIDGQLMKTSSAHRTFQTPDLKDGKAYFYDLKVELEREGQTLTQSQRVVLRPGAVVNASFAEMDIRATAVSNER